MAKRRSGQRRRPTRRHQPAQRPMNWPLLGGVVAAGLLGLAALLILALRQPEGFDLVGYCQDNPGRCLANGSADAPVTIVEVSDYGCPACRAFNLETAGLLEEAYVKTGHVRWLVLPYARPGVKEQTGPAAEAAFCAAEQDRFFDYHRALFAQQDLPQALSRAGYLEAAGELGLDVARFTACLDGGAYADIVEANIEAATAAGVRATPTFFINGVKAEGALPFAAFQQRLEARLPG